MFYFVVICSVFLASVAQLLLKSASVAMHKNFISEYLNVKVISGYGLMMLSLLTNIYAMSRGIQVKEVSIIESLSYMFVPMLSYFVFKEQISKRKILAIALIMCGVVVFFV